MLQSHYDRILGILCSVLDAYSAVLFLPEPAPSGERSKAEAFRLASAFSLGNSVNKNTLVSEGHGLVGWILRNREPLLVSNFDQRQNRLGYYSGKEEQSIKAFVGTPLPGGRGALCIDSKRQYSFSEKDQKVLHLFADLIARMYDEDSSASGKENMLKYYSALKTIYALRHQYSRWAEFLRRFLELIAAMTGFSYCTLFTRDSRGEAYTVEGENTPLLLAPAGSPLATPPVFPMSHGLVGWVFRNSKQVSTSGNDGSPETQLLGRDMDLPHFQTIFALPLVIQRKTRGVLCLAHSEAVTIEPAMQDFMQMAADHMALFLENLYVKCRLRDLHREFHSEA